MKSLIALGLLLLALALVLCSGCRSSGTIACIPHADGCGSTEIGFAAVGGGTRPGVMIVWTKTHGSSNSTPPNIIANVSGSPLAPSAFGATATTAGQVGAALALGSTWPDSENNHTSTTTLIQGGAQAPPITPPSLPPPSRPPFGPPPWQGTKPHNKGR